jgi:phosphohistidine phosphatase
MKYLYLLRHAKSSWEFGVSDWNRPLSERGVGDALFLSQLIKKNIEMPDLICSSDAVRALHTATIFHKTFALPKSQLHLAPELYLTTRKKLSKFIHMLPEANDRVMLVSHNPTLTEYFNSVVDHGVDNMPTCGMALLKFDVDTWSQVNENAELVRFEYPKKYKRA